MVARLATDAGEIAADVHGRAAHRQCMHQSTYIRIPGRWNAAGGVEGGEMVARLAADAGERAARIYGRAAHYQGRYRPIYLAIGIRVPGGGLTSGGVEGGEMVARLA